MAVLKKKVTASTLMETLVATVLIVVVFMVSSLVLNNLFLSNINGKHSHVQQELLQLQYKYQHGVLQLPYQNNSGPWQIRVNEQDWKSTRQVVFTAKHEKSGKEVSIRTNYE